MGSLIKHDYELYHEAKEKIKEIVKGMHGISEDEVIDRYIRDIHFHKGFDVLVEMYMLAKYK